MHAAHRAPPAAVPAYNDNGMASTRPSHPSPLTRRPMTVFGVAMVLAAITATVLGQQQPPPPAPDDDAHADPPVIVSLAWTAVNTSASLNLENGETHYTVRLSGRVEVPADTPILAVSHLVLLDHAIDRLGRDLLVSREGEDTRPAGARSVRHFNGIAPPGAEDGVSTVHVTAMLNGVDNLPTVIRSLRGSVPVLLGQTTTTIELDDVAAMDSDKEVSKRVAVRIVEAGRDDGRYEVRLKWRLKHEEEDQRTYYSNLRMIRQVVLEDDAGNRLHGQPGKRSAFRRTREMSEGEMTFEFALPRGRQAASLQAEVVTQIKPSSFEIRAENIPMPGSHSQPGV